MFALLKRNLFIICIFILTISLAFITFLTFIDKSFIKLNDDFVILDAHYSRYNSKYKKIFFGRGLFYYKKVNTKWKLFEVTTL